MGSLPIQIGIEGVNKRRERRFKVVGVTEEDPVNRGHGLWDPIVGDGPTENWDQPLLVHRSVCDFLPARLRANRLGTDHENEIVSAFDARVDFS